MLEPTMTTNPLGAIDYQEAANLSDEDMLALVLTYGGIK